MGVRKTVLVVDDNRLNRIILCNILRSDGYSTLEAENGQDALEALQNKANAVSLVLLDIKMPVMDGYGLLKRMSETGLITSIPVIITTGDDEQDAEIRCLDLGASDFIKKPYNAELVRHRVRSLMRLCDNAALINRLETDRLTGVYTKEFFFQYAETMLDEHPDESFDIVYTDIENFKMINARYGITVGDELLRYIVSHHFGMMNDDVLAGRISADMFALLKKSGKNYTQEEVGALYAEAFRDAPVKNFQFKSGVYHIHDRSLSVADMCEKAKLAVETVKNQYGVYFAVYDDSMREKALREHQLANCMDEALYDGQFLVYLQPKHCAKTCEVAGAEALVRWMHPELGFVSPGLFVPLFERNGFIAKLDFHIWGRVCAILRRWMDCGRELVPVSINASRADFMASDLPERIERLVDSYGIPHEFIHFEVTESAYTDNPQQLIAAVSALQDMGFKIEMDDFGSGYSSLNMLSELPIDILKLDMRFIQGGNDRIKDGKRNILGFIMNLSKWLELPTVAEGVETGEEFESLKAMGCDYIQGYYFAKPMPTDEFEKYIDAHGVRT